jgi:hypothetical protein
MRPHSLEAALLGKSERKQAEAKREAERAEAMAALRQAEAAGRFECRVPTSAAASMSALGGPNRRWLDFEGMQHIDEETISSEKDANGRLVIVLRPPCRFRRL